MPASSIKCCGGEIFVHLGFYATQIGS